MPVATSSSKYSMIPLLLVAPGSSSSATDLPVPDTVPYPLGSLSLCWPAQVGTPRASKHRFSMNPRLHPSVFALQPRAEPQRHTFAAVWTTGRLVAACWATPWRVALRSRVLRRGTCMTSIAGCRCACQYCWMPPCAASGAAGPALVQVLVGSGKGRCTICGHSRRRAHLPALWRTATRST